MEKGKISKEDEIELNRLNQAAKEVINRFVVDFFGKSAVKQLKEAFQDYSIGLDPVDKKCNAYCSYGKKEIMLYDTYFRNSKDTVALLKTIIHEYAHSFSHTCSKGIVNDVFEEAFANLLAESAINNYLNKYGKLPYVSEKENEKVKEKFKGKAKEKGYHEIPSYKREGQFLKTLLIPLSENGLQFKAMREYFFEGKDKFKETCTRVYGEDFKTLLRKMSKIKINIKENTSNDYMQDVEDFLKDMLKKQFRKGIPNKYLRNKEDFSKEDLYEDKSEIVFEAQEELLLKTVLNGNRDGYLRMLELLNDYSRKLNNRRPIFSKNEMSFFGTLDENELALVMIAVCGQDKNQREDKKSKEREAIKEKRENGLFSAININYSDYSNGLFDKNRFKSLEAMLEMFEKEGLLDDEKYERVRYDWSQMGFRRSYVSPGRKEFLSGYVSDSILKLLPDPNREDFLTKMYDIKQSELGSIENVLFYAELSQEIDLKGYDFPAVEMLDLFWDKKSAKKDYDVLIKYYQEQNRANYTPMEKEEEKAFKALQLENEEMSDVVCYLYSCHENRLDYMSDFVRMIKEKYKDNIPYGIRKFVLQDLSRNIDYMNTQKYDEEELKIRKEQVTEIYSVLNIKELDSKDGKISTSLVAEEWVQ